MGPWAPRSTPVHGRLPFPTLFPRLCVFLFVNLYRQAPPRTTPADPRGRAEGNVRSLDRPSAASQVSSVMMSVILYVCGYPVTQFPEVKQFRSSAIPAAQRAAAGRQNPRLLTSEITGEGVYYTI